MDRLLRDPPSAKFEPCGDPFIDFYDRKFNRIREIMVYHEETKLWGAIQARCQDIHGPAESKHQCAHYGEVIAERKRYSRSGFERQMRPTLSPGIPPDYERDSLPAGYDPKNKSNK